MSKENVVFLKQSVTFWDDRCDARRSNPPSDNAGQSHPAFQASSVPNEAKGRERYPNLIAPSITIVKSFVKKTTVHL